MHRHALVWLLLSSAALAQTQYGTASKPGTAALAPAGCPWLTSGSAAHALGGDVSATVKVSNSGEGSCNFSRREGPPDALEILVSKAALLTCPSDSMSLKGIGNEAHSCKPRAARGEVEEMITSRVRDLHFTVLLTTRSQKIPSKSDDPQNDALEQIAEQVAGNLY
jgi:hypothetical protein